MSPLDLLDLLGSTLTLLPALTLSLFDRDKTLGTKASSAGGTAERP